MKDEVKSEELEKTLTFDSMPGVEATLSSWDPQYTVHLKDQSARDPSTGIYIATVYQLPFTTTCLDSKTKEEIIYIPKNAKEFRYVNSGWGASTGYPGSEDAASVCNWGETVEEALLPLYHRYLKLAPVWRVWGQIRKLQGERNELANKIREINSPEARNSVLYLLPPELRGAAEHSLALTVDNMRGRELDIGQRIRLLEKQLIEAAARGWRPEECLEGLDT